VVANLDAAGLAGDAASALASAAFVALEREREGVGYAALADEASHSATDPRRAAFAAAEAHDEISRRLEAERSARDDVESKRARIADALLYDTPGSRVDSFIRTGRSTIEARLRRFGLGDGDPTVNYRDLLRDFTNLGAGSRYAVMLRATWAYRGQIRLLIFAIVAFALAYGIDWLRSPSGDAALRSLGDWVGPGADWLGAHGEGLRKTAEGAIGIGVLAVLTNIWRAASFTALLFRGLRLLTIDTQERRRELDASSARLERRVAALGAEAEAASKRAEAMAKRAGGAQQLARAPGPVFLKALQTPTKAARDFFAELGRLMTRPATPNLPVPQRLIFVIDNVGVLPPAEGARLIEVTSALMGPGCVALIACDPVALSSAPRTWTRDSFQIVFDPSTLNRGDGARLAARLMASSLPLSPVLEVDAGRSALAEPLSPDETALLTTLASILEPTPRALKRFHNAYRLARVSGAPRPLIALILAALQSPDAELAVRLRDAMRVQGDRFEDPAGPPTLVAATKAARATHGGPIAKADALAAWDAARRYTLAVVARPKPRVEANS
jgi:hypothetical protein